MNILHTLFDQDNKFNIKLENKKNNLNILETLYNYKSTNELYDENVLSQIKFNKIKEKIDMTLTVFGKKHFNKLIDNPLTDILELKMRQKKIKKYKIKRIREKKISILLKIKNIQNDILSLWDENKFMNDMIYFENDNNIFDKINKNTIAQQIINIYKIYISPFITIVSPIFFIILPIIFMKCFNINIKIVKIFNMVFRQIDKMTKKISMGNNSPYLRFISMFMWFIFYIQNSYTSLMSALNTNKIINIYHNKLKKVNTFIELYNELCEKKINKLDLNLNYYDNKGKIISLYYCLMKNKDFLIDMFKQIGEIDCYVGINKLCELNYNFTKFITYKKPIINIKKLFHPLISNNILNDLNIRKNILITGPNKSGKSTFLKSCLISVILSQSLCVSNSLLILTPFNYINCDINLPDIEDKNSLFEVELNKVSKIIEKIKKTKKYMLNITDEIFSSTNTKECISLSYGIIKNIINYENLISLITTHQYELSELEKTTKIKNYCFRYNDELDFTYKIKKGVSKQYTGIKLLEKSKFDIKIINDCKKKFDA